MKSTSSATNWLGIAFAFFLLCMGFTLMSTGEAEAMDPECWKCEEGLCFEQVTGEGWEGCEGGHTECTFYGSLGTCAPE